MLDDIDDLNVPQYYAVAAIYFVGEQNVGRRKLAERIGLSESRTRTMLDHLRDHDYLTADTMLQLTDQGADVYQALETHTVAIAPVTVHDLAVDDVTIGAVVRDVGDRIGTGIQIRDEAVRAGATGMTVLRYDDGFRFPGGGPGQTDVVTARDQDCLYEAFDDVQEGDILLLAAAADEETAKAGLWRAMTALME